MRELGLTLTQVHAAVAVAVKAAALAMILAAVQVHPDGSVSPSPGYKYQRWGRGKGGAVIVDHFPDTMHVGNGVAAQSYGEPKGGSQLKGGDEENDGNRQNNEQVGPIGLPLIAYPTEQASRLGIQISGK